MSQAESFAPLEGRAAHTLILGSMPGQASLTAARYYAHPRNAFWPIMLAIIGGQSEASFESVQAFDYTQRCTLLTSGGYALWDVLARCERPGSLDSRIVRASEQANDIAGLVRRHPQLDCIACNGKAAEKLLVRHCGASLDALQGRLQRQLRIVSLPSSSPAMASLTLAQKHQRWADGLLG
ncbi:DNA-deoxyinosine glycosylase [Granulosicoccus sp. 3-233]|uniref:DNA-deoxyinosine glycosylase n=1 Tax=Granulosicoccus sp. 3-233 TaxID=3417969 RepID=UPI003D33FBDE